MYQCFLVYKSENGGKPVEQNCILADGTKLGEWVSTQRRAYKQGKMLPERIRLLNDAGIVWDAFQYKWDSNFSIARQYYEENGHLNVQRTEDPTLYTWLRSQIGAYKGQRGRITPSQIQKLESIGMTWNLIEDEWLGMYSLAKEYYSKHQKLNIPVSLTVDGKNLGRWLAHQRKAYRNYINGIRGKGKAKMTPERIELLEAIGIEWDVTYLGRKCSFPENAIFFYIRKIFPDAIKVNQEDFLGKELDIYIPSINVAIEYDGYTWHHDKYETDSKKDLFCTKNGIEMIRIREPKLEKLESSVCFMMDSTSWKSLEKTIVELVSFFGKKAPDCNIERDYLLIHEDHIQYMSHKWDVIYEVLLNRYETSGDVIIRPGEITDDGVDLYGWVSKQREAYHDRTMCADHINKLQNIGIVLDPFEEKWNQYYQEAVIYYNEHGNLLVPISYNSNGLALGKWISHKREDYKLNRLRADRVALLENIGMCWAVSDFIQSQNRALLAQYRQEFGNLPIKANTEYRGFKLGRWIQGKKKANKAGKLSLEELDYFVSQGIVL